MRALTSIAVAAGLAFGCKHTDPSTPITVDQLVAAPDDHIDDVVVVTGWVKPGSITAKIVDQRSRQEFVLESKGKELRVVHTGPTPDSFTDQADMKVRGKLVRDGGQLVVVSGGDDLFMAKRY